MDEATWWAAQEAEPLNLLILAEFSDWLQEQGDDRWEGAAWLYEARKIGSVEAPLRYGGDWRWTTRNDFVPWEWWTKGRQYHLTAPIRDALTESIHRRDLLLTWDDHLTKAERRELWRKLREEWIPPEKRPSRPISPYVAANGNTVRINALSIGRTNAQIGTPVIDDTGSPSRIVGHVLAINADGTVDVVVHDAIASLSHRSVELWDRTYSRPLLSEIDWTITREEYLPDE